MPIHDLDARLRRLTETLSRLLDGEFDAIEHYAEIADDPLGRIEETVEFLVLDTKTVTLANRDKEASLLMQYEELDAQQRRILAQERELEAKVALIERQAAAIRELSTPILEVWEGVMVLPVVGVIDTQRSAEIMSSVLAHVARGQTRWVIIDITGVELVDTHTATHLIKVVHAARLLGAACLLSGVQPVVAQALVDLGVDLSEVATRRNLADALKYCLGQARGAVSA